MTNQSLRQQAVRDRTGTSYDHDADWLALFAENGVTTGSWNERCLAWINIEMGASYANLADAQQAYAVAQGFDDWDNMTGFAADPPDVEQDTGNQTTSGATSDTATFASSTVTGRGVIVLFALKSGRRVSTLTDNKGNTYVRVGFAVDASDAVVEMWYAQPITGGASHTLTVTFDAAAYCVWGAIEVSRVKGGGGFLDARATATFTRAGAGSSASVTVTSGTPRGSNELFVAMLALAGGGADAGIDTPSLYTAITQFNNYDSVMAGHGAYRTNGTANAISATWTNDTTTAPAAAIIAAFRATNAVSAGVSAPVNTVLPVISGTPTEDETLTTTTGTWSNSPDAYTYQWKADAVAISGATASSYVLTASEIDADITVTVTAHNEGGTASATSAAVGPVAAGGPSADAFDGLSTSASAMISCVRRLRSGYAGSLIRVRRSSDNTEQDIGVGGDGFLDTASLLSFVGGGDAYVRTAYDQSGGAYHFHMTGQSVQPRIVASGVVDTNTAGYPAMKFSGGQRFDGAISSNYISSTAYTTCCAVKSHTTITTSSDPYNNDCVWQAADRVGVYLHGAPKIVVHHYTTSHTAAEVAASAAPFDAVVGARFNGSDVKAFYNGTMGTGLSATSIGSYTPNTMKVGHAFSEYYDGFISEIAWWTSSISNADLNQVGEAMAGITGSTWTTVT